MIFLEERTTHLSLAVIFNDVTNPDVNITKDEVSLIAIGVVQEPFYQREGYWLFMDLPTGSVTISWKATHYKDGEQIIDLSTLPILAPIVTINLVM